MCFRLFIFIYFESVEISGFDPENFTFQLDINLYGIYLVNELIKNFYIHILKVPKVRDLIPKNLLLNLI